MTRQNADAFCHPEGVFYTFAIGKERKNDRQDPVHLCVGGADGIFNYLDSSLTGPTKHICVSRVPLLRMTTRRQRLWVAGKKRGGGIGEYKKHSPFEMGNGCVIKGTFIFSPPRGWGYVLRIL